PVLSEARLRQDLFERSAAAPAGPDRPRQRAHFLKRAHDLRGDSLGEVSVRVVENRLDLFVTQALAVADRTVREAGRAWLARRRGLPLDRFHLAGPALL